MDFEIELEPELDAEGDPISFQNEFTGGKRESLLPPEANEPICLISYEITFILLGGGPDQRSSFWRAYRRELALNRKTEYRNYHVEVCRAHLVSLRMRLDHPVYFRHGRLTTEKPLDAFTQQALTDGRFN